MLLWIGILLVVMGFTIVCVAICFYRLAQRQRQWMIVPGTIVNSAVRFEIRYFDPVVDYIYEVNGQRYGGWKIRSGMVHANWRGPADRLVSRYPKDAAVDVYVNPKNPQDAVLEPGGDWYFLPLVVFCAGLCSFIGISFVVLESK